MVRVREIHRIEQPTERSAVIHRRLAHRLVRGKIDDRAGDLIRLVIPKHDAEIVDGIEVIAGPLEQQHQPEAVFRRRVFVLRAVGVHIDRDQPHRQVIVDDKAHQLLQEGDALGELCGP